MSLLFMAVFVALLYMATGARRLRGHRRRALRRRRGARRLARARTSNDRFSIWLDPWAKAETTGYQLLQSLFTIADGGVLGAGFGRGFLLYSNRQPVVPDLQTDFIFAAIANEMGLLGAVAVVLCFLLFFWRGIRIATQGAGRLLQAARRRARHRLRPADVHHPRRRHAPDPAHRHHAAVRELRRQLDHRQPRPGGAAAHGVAPHQRGARRHRPRAPAPGGAGVRRDDAEGTHVNKAIGRVFIVGVVLFVAVILNLTWLQVIRADHLAERPENKRQLAKELRIKRGSILAFDGSVIARSVRRSGFYQRRYPQRHAGAAARRLRHRALRAQRHRAADERRAARQGARARRPELARPAPRTPAEGRRRRDDARPRRAARRPAGARRQDGRDRRPRPRRPAP